MGHRRSHPAITPLDAMKGQRLIMVFLVGVVLLNYPVITIANRAITLGGVPLLYAYLFAVWGVLIVLAGWIVEQSSRRGSDRIDP